MEWTAEVSAGDWVRGRIDDPWRGTIHDVVPRGFASHTRVLHPASRSKPVGADWPAMPHDDHRRAWEAFGAAGHEVDTVTATWADAAAAFGTALHAGAQWGSLVRAREAEWNPSGWQQVLAPDGWMFNAPMEGELDAASLAALVELAAAHTMTPDDLLVAVWEGWGGLVGAMGHGSGRAILTFTDEPTDAESARHQDLLARMRRDALNEAFRKPTWQPGILSDEISRGPRLSLPARDHVLFRGSAAELARTDWPDHVPWADRESEFPFAPASPSLVWPADRAWVIVTEVDWDSTIVAGPPGLSRALCADPRLEALPMRAGVSLTYDSDEVNR